MLRQIKKIITGKGIKFAPMQYPTRPIVELKGYFDFYEDVIFISNEENFEEALANYEYEEIFIDHEAPTFGHTTRLGNEIIARNVADVIITELNISN